ncbi:hypothetical protein B296_00040152 [Ensete ventricosum]|uniref:Uncharacterized protein n=1 Tax=Ensete ventricosum TaxID=4639 RepID=A0A426ZR37_ENSVE|nr:hypothetical protein B296_00040152 [Ensete ventricosum]
MSFTSVRGPIARPVSWSCSRLEALMPHRSIREGVHYYPYHSPSPPGEEASRSSMEVPRKDPQVHRLLRERSASRISFASSHFESRSVEILARRSRALSLPFGNSRSTTLVSVFEGAAPVDSGTVNTLATMRSNFDIDSTVTTHGFLVGMLRVRHSGDSRFIHGLFPLKSGTSRVLPDHSY